MENARPCIRVRGARVHNLHNLDIDLPRGQFIVLTGPSGSGKSSLAFDTLYAEGQRRYLETLRVDTRALFDQLQRPDVDLVDGLPPTLCVSQQAHGTGRRSTLGTLTEIHDHFRLLWARLGIPHCPKCGRALCRQTLAEIIRQVLALEPDCGTQGRKVYLLAPLVHNQKGEHREAFQQIRQAGFVRARIDGTLTELGDLPPLNPRQPHTIEMVVDRLVIRGGIVGQAASLPGIQDRLAESLQTAVKHGGGTVIVTDIDSGDWQDKRYCTRNACPDCGTDEGELEPALFSFNSPRGACPACGGLGQTREIDPDRVLPDRSLTLAKALAQLRDRLPDDCPLPALDRTIMEALLQAFPHPEKKSWSAKTALKNWPAGAVAAVLYGTQASQPPFLGLVCVLRDYFAARADEEEAGDDARFEDIAGSVPCRACGGSRLNASARSVRFAGKGIHEVTALTVGEARVFFEAALGSLPAGSENENEADAKIRQLIVKEILHRLRFLDEVGLGYLTLDRPAPTLSGGEAQRARLATHLGSGLLGVCYILDEPTVGLHPRDTARLLAALRELQQRGNTLIVVEHDEAVIRQADFLVDIGPGAGRQGGRLLAHGTVAEVLANPASVTATYLRDQPSRTGSTEPRSPSRWLAIHGARHHNLKNIDVRLPLGCLVCITGVSGSGKSSLARDILCYAARRKLGLSAPLPGAHDRIDGLESIDKVIEVDQAPLGRSSRSNPATYTGLFDEVRKVYAGSRLAKARGYKASRFSFNVKGGRCEECQGQGALRVALQFLPDLTVPCPLCRGKRFNRTTLEITYKGRSITDVLDMPAAEAREFFENIPALVRPLAALVEVGLGYIALGQPSGALSGGEAQRVKLAAELARPATGSTLYLLDEPTTGLHFADVANLLRVLGRLVDVGNTLVVIEHHLDVIAAADWVIDLGPEGGAAGGYLLAAGKPHEVARCPASITGRYLQRALFRLLLNEIRVADKLESC